jgi:hypothetical protein
MRYSGLNAPAVAAFVQEGTTERGYSNISVPGHLEVRVQAGELVVADGQWVIKIAGEVIVPEVLHVGS